MIAKIVLLFLAFIGVLGIFGKLRVPARKDLRRLATGKCPKCGRYRIGKGPCACGEGRS